MAERRGGGGKFGKFGKPVKMKPPEQELTWRNIEYLKQFVTSNGRIHSRKRTGFNGQNQRKLTIAIKHARFLGLLPFVGRG